MTVTKLDNGGYQISDIIKGFYVARTFIGYTKRAAIHLFLNSVKEDLAA